jgi:hypothetical protein
MSIYQRVFTASSQNDGNSKFNQQKCWYFPRVPWESHGECHGIMSLVDFPAMLTQLWSGTKEQLEYIDPLRW